MVQSENTISSEILESVRIPRTFAKSNSHLPKKVYGRFNEGSKPQLPVYTFHRRLGRAVLVRNGSRELFENNLWTS